MGLTPAVQGFMSQSFSPSNAHSSRSFTIYIIMRSLILPGFFDYELA